jgi:hypothetical protein
MSLTSRAWQALPQADGRAQEQPRPKPVAVVYLPPRNAGIAAKELAAFLAVVNQDFGPQRACEAAADWLRQLVCSDCFAPEAIANFRQITIAAASRLVHRITEGDLEPNGRR